MVSVILLPSDFLPNASLKTPLLPLKIPPSPITRTPFKNHQLRGQRKSPQSPYNKALWAIAPFINHSNQPPKSTPLRAIHNQSTPSTRTPLGHSPKNQPEINQNAHFVSTLTPTAQTTQLPTNQPLTPNFPSSPFCTSRYLPPKWGNKAGDAEPW